MIDILDKSDCTGCALCHDVCPNGAITMIPDSVTGFLFPVINKDCCILNTTKPDFNPHKTRTFCIFHIPVLKYKSQMYKKKIYLLEIPVIKIKTSVSRIVFYILGIPVIKIKQ